MFFAHMENLMNKEKGEERGKRGEEFEADEI